MKKLMMAMASCALVGAVQAAGTLTVEFGTEYSGYTVWAVNFWGNGRSTWSAYPSVKNQDAPAIGYGTDGNNGTDYVAILNANTSNPDAQIALLNNNAKGKDYAMWLGESGNKAFSTVDTTGQSTLAENSMNMYSWLFILLDTTTLDNGNATYGTKYAVIQGPEQTPQVDNPGTPSSTYNDISTGYTITPAAANVLTSGTIAIPEPTSGLLLLLGVAGLALKRKRV